MYEHDPYNEPELIRRVAEGNQAAFERLVRAYQQRLFSYIYKVTTSRELTLDLVQDIFLNLWLRKEKLTGITNFNAYLHRIAHNEVYHSLQRFAKEELVLHQIKKESQQTEDAHSHLLSKEVRELIQSIVDRLSPRQKEVFLLSREEGLKYDEIADRLGIGFETVKFHLAEALKFLRSELREKYGTRATVIFVIWQLGNI